MLTLGILVVLLQLSSSWTHVAVLQIFEICIPDFTATPATGVVCLSFCSCHIVALLLISFGFSSLVWHLWFFNYDEYTL
jgi:hypothetical protein